MTEQLGPGLSVSSTTWPQLVCPSAADHAPAPDLPHTCYTVVQPGLQSGSMHIEFQVQSMRSSSRGVGGLKFWVVSLGCQLARHSAGLSLLHLLPNFGGRGIDMVHKLGLMGWEQLHLGAKVISLPAPEDPTLGLAMCSSRPLWGWKLLPAVCFPYMHFVQLKGPLACA